MGFRGCLYRYKFRTHHMMSLVGDVCNHSRSSYVPASWVQGCNFSQGKIEKVRDIMLDGTVELASGLE